MSNNEGVVKDVSPEAAKSLEASLVSLVDGSRGPGGHADQEARERGSFYSFLFTAESSMTTPDSFCASCRCHPHHRTQQVPPLDIQAMAV